MRAQGSPLLRFAILCALGAISGAAALGQFLQPPDTNLFGNDFVKTIDIRAGGVVLENNPRGKKSAPIEGYENLLLFRDGRQLRGRLMSVGRDEIIWSRPDFNESLHFPRMDARRVFLTPDAPNGLGIPNGNRFIPGGRRAGVAGARSTVVPATIKLSGNDWLRGGVTSPDGQTFVLSLENSRSTVTAPRSRVEWLLFDWNTARGGGFDGSVLDAEDWLASAPSATLSDDGNLVIAGENEWFGQFLPQPALFEISMEISADSERDLHLWLQPSAPMPNSFTTGAVDVGFGPKQLSLQRFTTAMEQKKFPVPDPDGQDAKGMVRYRIFYDSDKHRLIVFRNGRNVVDWNPDESKPGEPPKNSVRPELLTYLIRMSLPDTVASASIGAAVNAMQPPVDGLCMSGVPGLLAIASHSRFIAQFLASELRARYPRINSLSLSRMPADGDHKKSPLKLHRFDVSPWDGALPQEGEISATEDKLSSAASGSVAGKLDSITEKDVLFSQQSNPKLPRMFIRLPRESGAPFDSVARAGLGAAGELSVASLEIREGRAHLHTAFADDLALPAAALSALSFPSVDPRPAATGASLVFKNGDELPGALLSAAHDAPLRWKMSGGQEISVQLKNLAGVRLATPAPSRAAAENAGVELRNGDRLRGAVISLDEHRLDLQEPFLGPLSVDRSRIWKLFPRAGAEIRDGADDPEGWVNVESNPGPFQNRLPPGPPGWKTTKLSWLYFDGCYLPRQSPRQNGQMDVRFLASPVPRLRDGLFEVRAEITETTGNLLNAIISIAGKQNPNGAASSITINFSGMEIYVNVMDAARGQEARQVPLGEKMKHLSTRLSFRIFVNSVLGTADIMLNGVLVARVGQQTNERAPGADQAVQLGGFSYDGQPMIFSNLWIGPWDGELPRPETAGHASTGLANGDVTAGVPSALQDGKYLLETEVGPLRLPVSSVNAIAFGGESAPTRSAARLRLLDGSIVHLAGYECRDGALAGHSDLFGDLHVPFESIAEIVFNPEPLRAPLGPAPKKPAPPAADSAGAGPGKPSEIQ